MNQSDKKVNIGHCCNRAPSNQWPVMATVINALTGVAAYVVGYLGGDFYLASALWVICYIAGGFFGVFSAYEALREGKINIDILMILAALGSAYIGAYAEGGGLLFLFSLSNTLQSYALERSFRSISTIMDLKPDMVSIKKNNNWIDKNLDEVKIGDICLVRPGSNIALDGVVISGKSDVNQAPITGESMLVIKQPGSLVYAGSGNKTGILEFKVSSLNSDSTLSKILVMVEKAQASKSKTQSKLERLEGYYAIFVLAVSGLLLLVSTVVLGDGFYDSFYKTITWLVVASPCALIIAIPASYLSAIANAAMHGVIFKGGISMERAAEIKAVALDKTGTLTYGQPRVVDVYSPDMKVNELMASILPLELKSEHLLAQTIVKHAKEQNINSTKEVQDFKSIPGRGVEGKIGDYLYVIGNKGMFIDRQVAVPKLFDDQAKAMGDKGEMIVFVALKNADGYKFLAVIGFLDQIRKESSLMVKSLRAMGIKNVVMLTGDHTKMAASISKELSLDNYYAELLPEQKLAMIKEISKKDAVAMVGDGVNDAPSLAAANLSISMGEGANDMAISTAEVILMSNDLRKIPFLLSLSRQARRVVYQNLTIALSVMVTLSVINFGFGLPLTVGVVAHEGSTLLAALNGLRLLFFKDSQEV